MSPELRKAIEELVYCLELLGLGGMRSYDKSKGAARHTRSPLLLICHAIGGAHKIEKGSSNVAG